MEKVWRLAEPYVEWGRLNASLLVLGVFIVLAVAVSMPHKPRKTGFKWENFKPRSWRRRGKMLRNDRREMVLNLITNDFVSSVEDRVGNGEITRQEASEIYRLLKQRFPIRNLFPNPERLKENIKNRLGKHVKPNLPGTVRKKHMLDRAERVVL